MSSISYGLLIALAIALLFAAFTDIRRRQIDNWLNLAIALGAPVFWWSQGLALWPDIAIQLGVAAGAFAIFAALFAFKVMGGGDVKLLTALALRERGFDIVEARGGEQALELLRNWTPDIIVLDAMMPEPDGFQTCMRLREMPGFESIPVLMLTGLDDDTSINRAYQVGATDFFVKATQWSLLAGRLRYLLRSSRTRLELERSKAKLARAQDLARMGSFEWWRGVQASFNWQGVYDDALTKSVTVVLKNDVTSYP